MHDMKSSHYVVYQLELKQKLPDRKTCTRSEGDFASSKGGGAITAAAARAPTFCGRARDGWIEAARICGGVLKAAILL